MVERNRIRLLTGAVASVFLAGLSGCAWPVYEGPPHYYDYYYYPHAAVYFHIYTGWYFYLDDGRWRRVRQLPPHIRLDPRLRHPLQIREKEPWQRHDEHRRKYPPPPQPGRGTRPESVPQRGDRRPPPSDTRSSAPPTRRESRPPAPAPEDRRDRERDRAEREHNIRRHEEYRKKP